MEGILLFTSIVLQHPNLHLSFYQILAQCVNGSLHDIIDNDRRFLLCCLVRIGMRVDLLAEAHAHRHHISSIVALVLKQTDKAHHDFFVEWLGGLLDGGSALFVGGVVAQIEHD